MEPIEAFVKRRLPIPAIPSASGMAFLNDSLYIIGDDSPWLFVLNKEYSITRKIRLIEGVDTFRLPKLLKPDLEAMTHIETSEGSFVLILGSGSKSPERDKLILVDLNGSDAIQSYTITALYDHIRQVCHLRPSELNIEGVASKGDNLLLLNRGVNLIISLNIVDVLAYLKDGALTPPVLEVLQLTLPSLNNTPTGLSGAVWVPDMQSLLFTASAELTDNWIDDGLVSGSYIGLYALNPDTPPVWTTLKQDGAVLPVKVESVAVRKMDPDGTLHLILATDADGADSELIEIELKTHK